LLELALQFFARDRLHSNKGGPLSCVAELDCSLVREVDDPPVFLAKRSRVLALHIEPLPVSEVCDLDASAFPVRGEGEGTNASCHAGIVLVENLASGSPSSVEVGTIPASFAHYGSSGLQIADVFLSASSVGADHECQRNQRDQSQRNCLCHFDTSL